MSYAGGIANKHGNIYEAKWAVRQLLDVLQGDAEAIRFESIASDDQGFELSVERNGVTEHHQSKRRNSDGNWTLVRLGREGVLRSFQLKLSASQLDKCVFVSQYPAHQLDALIEKAAHAQSGSELRGSLGADAAGSLDELRRIWSVPLDTAFAWLRRIKLHVLPESEIDSHLTSHVRLFFEEQPDKVIPVLRAFLESRMNRRLTTEDIRREVRDDAQLKFKDWALDSTLGERLERQTDAYLASYLPHGISSVVIPRAEAGQALRVLCASPRKRVLILTGKAGVGKSGVARQIIEGLREDDIPCLAFRIDRMLEGGGPATLDALGQQLTGRNESPVISLVGKFPDRRTVLLVDQVDAVSDISGRGQRLKDIVLTMLDEAIRFPNVHIVLVCREFDFSNDQRLKSLERGANVQRITVELLDWNTQVTPVLSSLQVDPNSFRASEKELLRLPLNLALFSTLDAPDRIPGFRSTADLLEKLVTQKERALANVEHPFSVWTALGAMAERIESRRNAILPEQHSRFSATVGGALGV